MKKRMTLSEVDSMFGSIDDDFSFDLTVKPLRHGGNRNEDYQQRQKYKNLSRESLEEIVDKYR